MQRCGPHLQQTARPWSYPSTKLRSANRIHEVRNLRPSFGTPLGALGGLAYSGLDAFILRGRAPWTFSHHGSARGGDHALTLPAASSPKIEYPRPDGKISFDIMTSVSRSGTTHDHDQPSHLRLKDGIDAVKHTATHWREFRGVESRFCPAGVYEYVDDPDGPDGKRFVINAQNCVHCKTCDIKVPGQDIDWTPPQGGEGPKYVLT